MTRDQALRMASSGWWYGLPSEDIVAFQLYEKRLCMDFNDYHRAIEEALGRPVFAHEFVDPDRLRGEFEGKRPPATLADILALIPEEKRLIIVDDEESAGSFL